MTKFPSKSKGFIKMAIIIVGALVLLKYVYKVDVVDFLTTGKFKVWLDKFYNIAILGWEKYDTIILKIWNYLIDFVKNIFNNK